jgi:NTE family protein
VLERFLARAAVEGMSQEADWASYLLFDGRFAERLIELGRADARARADEIRAVFADS